VLVTQLVFAQLQVTGKVTDATDGTPLAGVTVSVKNSNIPPVLTDATGSFSLNTPPKSKLNLSYVGYQGLEEVVSSSMNITMAKGSNSLTEVVVLGYGSKIKRDVTGAVAKVGAKELANSPVTSFENAIQGRAAGVFVEQQNGKLGQGIKIRIRGASSVTAGNEPLYVIDGIPVITSNLSSNGAQTNPLSDINTNDIESVEILKDASSAAIYGSRLSNTLLPGTR
jgi:TonB-dependent SusC/RagA subfamily outer membrane receptor